MKKAQLIELFDNSMKLLIDNMANNMAELIVDAKKEYIATLNSKLSGKPTKTEKVEKPKVVEERKPKLSDKKIVSENIEFNNNTKTGKVMVNNIPIEVDLTDFDKDVNSASVLDDKNLSSFFDFEKMKRLSKIGE